MHTFCLRCACGGKEHRHLPAGRPCQSTLSCCFSIPALLHPIVAICPRAPGTQCDSHRLLHQSCRPGTAWLHLDLVTLVTSGTMPWTGCSPWGDSPGEGSPAGALSRGRGGDPGHGWSRAAHQQLPAQQHRTTQGTQAEPGQASTCRVKSKALAHKTRSRNVQISPGSSVS